MVRRTFLCWRRAGDAVLCWRLRKSWISRPDPERGFVVSTDNRWVGFYCLNGDEISKLTWVRMQRPLIVRVEFSQMAGVRGAIVVLSCCGDVVMLTIATKLT